MLADRLIAAGDEGEKPLVDVTDVCDWLMSMDYDVDIFRFVHKAVLNNLWLDKTITDPDNRAKLVWLNETSSVILLF